MILKTCPKCKERKPRSEFGKNKSRKDGLQYRCKKCACEAAAQYYKENPEYHKQYQKENAERIKQYDKQYRKENAERIKQYNKQYQKNQPDCQFYP